MASLNFGKQKHKKLHGRPKRIRLVYGGYPAHFLEMFYQTLLN